MGGAAACSIPGVPRATVKNDLDAPVTVTLCPQQDCGGQQPQVIPAGKTIKFRVTDGETPDAMEVLDEAGNKTCDLLLPGGRLLISKSDPSVC